MKTHSGPVVRLLSSVFGFWSICLLLSFGSVLGENHTLFYRASAVIVNRNFSSDIMDTEGLIRKNLSHEVFVGFQVYFTKVMKRVHKKKATLLNITNKDIYFSPPSYAEPSNTSLVQRKGYIFKEPESGLYFLMLLQLDFDIFKDKGSVENVNYVKAQLDSMDMYIRRKMPGKPSGWFSSALIISNTTLTNLPETEARRMEDVIKYKNHYLASFLHQSGGISKTNLDVLSTLSYIGCGFSLFGLILTIITIVFFRKLRRLRANQILVQMCMALLGSLLFYTFGIRQIKDQSEIETCKAMSAMLHYFVLASMVWASIEAYNLYQDLVKVFDTSVLTQKEFVCRVSLVGWVLPGIIVGITVIASKTSYGFHVRETEEKRLCWMKADSFYFALLVPVLLLVLINTVLFVMVMREIFKMSQAHEKHSKMSQLRATTSVFILLGLNWIFAGLAAISPTLVLQYLFTITCSFQGFMIFVLHGIMKKDFQEAWKLLTTQNRVMEIIRSSHSQKTTSSTISRKSMVPTSSLAYSQTQPTKPSNLAGEMDDSGIEIRPNADPVRL